MKIAVIGGGRWARTIAGVLGSITEHSDRISIHSPANGTGIQAWIAGQGGDARFEAVRAWPDFNARERPDAVVVANRAGEHFAAAAAALRAGVPVLVEKPVCLITDEIEELGRIASAHGTFVAASHVFLFARYFEAYVRSVGQRGRLQGLDVIWTDAAAEMRRGETKSYDPTVTVFDDVLPHIVPMLRQIGLHDPSLVSLDVSRGGANVVLTLEASGSPVTITLARDDQERQRHIRAATASGTIELCFAREPGVIRDAATEEDGDPAWNTGRRPLATMLGAFLAATRGADPDARLSLAQAIASSRLAGLVRDRYLARQEAWLAQQLGTSLDAELRYALLELSESGAGDADVGARWQTLATPAQLRDFLAASPLRKRFHHAR